MTPPEDRAHTGYWLFGDSNKDIHLVLNFGPFKEYLMPQLPS